MLCKRRVLVIIKDPNMSFWGPRKYFERYITQVAAHHPSIHHLSTDGYKHSSLFPTTVSSRFRNNVDFLQPSRMA
jgi:hypothetical protein